MNAFDNERIIRDTKRSSQKLGQDIHALEAKERGLESEVQKGLSGIREVERKLSGDEELLTETRSLLQRATDTEKDLERKLSRDKDMLNDMKNLILRITQKLKENQSVIASLKSMHGQQEGEIKRAEQTAIMESRNQKK